MYTYVWLEHSYIFIYLLIYLFIYLFIYMYIYTFLLMYIYTLYIYIYIFEYIYILVQVELDKFCSAPSLSRFFSLQFSWCPDQAIRHNPPPWCSFRQKTNGWHKAPMCEPDSWKGGFKKSIRLSSKNSWTNCCFFFKDEGRNHGLADSDSPCKLFLRGVFLLVDRYVVSRNLSWWWLPTPHH